MIKPCRIVSRAFACAVAALTFLATCAATTLAADPPAPAPAQTKREADVALTFDYIMKEYTTYLGRTKDRLGRSMLLVGMSRIPRADATAQLLKVLKTDKDPLVGAVAWQCLMSRAGGLSQEEYRQWFDATPALVQKGAFRGDLRAPLVHFLAAMPPDKRARDMFAQMFAASSTMDPRDMNLIAALGECAGAWRDSFTVEWLMGRFAVLHDARRAEQVLRTAGIGTEIAGSETRFELGSEKQWQSIAADYAAWWKTEKKTFAGMTPAEGWKSLQSQYLPTVDFTLEVNPADKIWYRDLELRSPDLRTFGVGVMLDCTGSMQTAIMWLRGDVRKIMQALGLIALEPQISLTFYRDFGDEFITRTIPLTGRVDLLAKELAAMNAKGGGDEPEAIREALQDALKSSHWSTSPKSPKALVIIGDAQPHPETHAECVKIAQGAAAKGFRVYVVKVRTGSEVEAGWPALDAIAQAGGGTSMELDFRTSYFGGGGFPSMPEGPAIPPGLGAGFPGGAGGIGGGGAPPPRPPAIPRRAPRNPKAAPAPAPQKRRLRRSGFPALRKPRPPPPRREMRAPGPAPGAIDDASRPPGERIVTQIVVDVVNPQYADRVQPPVAILWQMLAEHEPEKAYPHPPIPKFTPPPIVNVPPPVMPRNFPPVRPPVAPPPYDPQKQR